MILLTRCAEPDTLRDAKVLWTERFLEARKRKPKTRPPHAQYAHERIVDALLAISVDKCFYCECKPDPTEREVDHYIEVAEAPERAFEWENLYLSCKGCNGKLPNSTHPCNACIDPCASTHDPTAHLAFDGDLIRPRDDSATGRATITKYRLNRGDLSLRRSRALRLFLQEMDGIKSAMIAEGRAAMSESEVERLRKYRQRDQPFSQMFMQLREMP